MRFFRSLQRELPKTETVHIKLASHPLAQDEEIVLVFELDPQKAQEVKAMMGEINMQDEAQFFNFALRLLKWAINEAKQGRIIASIHPNDEKEEPEVEDTVRIPITTSA